MNKITYFFKQFLPEVRAEWGKVTKPPRREVVQTTVVVVVTSFAFAIYLWASDQVIRSLYAWTLDAYEWTFRSLGW